MALEILEILNMIEFLRTIKGILLRMILRFKLLLCFIGDYRRYLKNSLSLGVKSQDKDKARILLIVHSLEKGLSFTRKKHSFGHSKANNLIDFLSSYILNYGQDNICLVAVNVLNLYFLDPFASKDQKLKGKFDAFINQYTFNNVEKLGGIKPVSIPDFNLLYSDIFDFYKQRTSVRDFSEKVVTNDEIQKALLLAKTTPTACNRQASKVHVFKDKNIIKSLIQNQLGDQSWCMNADTLFVISSNQSYFGGIYERSQVYIDGGLYAMNFLMGLHAQKIATCFKMYVRESKKDREFRKLAVICENEVPIVLILAGHYPTHKAYIPVSQRFQ